MVRTLFVVTALAGCSLLAAPALSQVLPAAELAAVETPAAPLAPTPLPTPAALPDAQPLPPDGSSPGQAVPALGADGRYVTLNRDLSRDATVWHMRAALNVAALGCRNGARIAAGYNAMLAAKKAELAAASAGADREYRARFAAAWQAQSDDAMTRLYNFFAQPPAQAGFCAAAEQVLAEVATVAPSAFADFAEGALPRLEAPFLAFYAKYARYQADLADWHARTPRIVMAAAAAPGPVPAAAASPAPVLAVAQTGALAAAPAPAASGGMTAAVAFAATPAAPTSSARPALPAATMVAAVSPAFERRMIGPGEP